MLGALSRGGVLKMVALADQGMSSQTKSQRASSLSWMSGLDGYNVFLTWFERG